MRRATILIALLIGALALVACGDDGGSADGPTKAELIAELNGADLFTDEQAECIADKVFDEYEGEQLEQLVDNPTEDVSPEVEETLSGFVEECVS